MVIQLAIEEDEEAEVEEEEVEVMTAGVGAEEVMIEVNQSHIKEDVHTVDQIETSQQVAIHREAIFVIIAMNQAISLEIALINP